MPCLDLVEQLGQPRTSFRERNDPRHRIEVYRTLDRGSLRLAELDVAVGDAAVRPALGDRDQAAGELADLEVVAGKQVVRDDDPHLVNLRLAPGADLVTVLRGD